MRRLHHFRPLLALDPWESATSRDELPQRYIQRADVKFGSVVVQPGHTWIWRGGGTPALDSDIPRLQVHTHNSSNSLPNSPSRSHFNDITGSAWLSSHMSKHDLRLESYLQLSCDKGQKPFILSDVFSSSLIVSVYSQLKSDCNITQNLVLHCWHWTVRLQWMHSSGLQTIMNSAWNLCLGCNITSRGNALNL
jgi:hypothetical protein